MSPQRGAGERQRRSQPARTPGCRIYCLVRRAEIAPALERLKLAGVAERDITVVLREAHAAAARVGRKRPTAGRRLAPWWSLPLHAALWWSMALYATPLPERQATVAAADPEPLCSGAGAQDATLDAVVVSLARYRAERAN